MAEATATTTTESASRVNTEGALNKNQGFQKSYSVQHRRHHDFHLIGICSLSSVSFAFLFPFPPQ